VIENKEYGSFIPCNSNGIYMSIDDITLQTNNDDDESEQYIIQPIQQSNEYIDIQIILTPQELESYAARRKATRAELKHSQRFLNDKMKHISKSSVIASTPYVDPKRIQKEIYRPAQPQKWIDANGFKVTGKKVE
jgi:hypothetical protein